MVFCEFITGWGAGIAGLFFGHPFDTIKVRQQTLAERSLTKTIINTGKKEGVKGFYRGLLFPMLSAGAYNSIFFGTYGNALLSLQNPDPKHHRRLCCEPGLAPPFWHFTIALAGAVGAIATSTIATPVELVKTQLQIITTPFKGKKMVAKDGVTGPFSMAKSIYKIGGLRALYTGTVPLLFRDVPGFTVYILTYEHALCKLQGKMNVGEQTHYKYDLLAGGLAGVLSWVLFLPFDFVKSRVQADNLKKPVYKGMMDCFQKSYHQGGPRIFFQGFWASVIRGFIVNAITFVVYEYLTNICFGSFTP